MDDEGGIEVVHCEFDDFLDCDPRNDLPAPEAKTGKLSPGDKVVDEIVRQAEQLGGLRNGQDQPLGHGGLDSAHDRERTLIAYYWCSDPPPFA